MIYVLSWAMIYRNTPLLRHFAMVALASIALPLWADDSTTLSMDALTVRVLTQTSTGLATGSGFLIGDGSMVVTNVHVVNNATAIAVLQGHRTGSGPREVLSSPASVLHYSSVKDLAILKLEQPFSRQGASFNLKGNLVERQKVCVVGFPGAADTGQDPKQIVAPKFSDGIVSAFVTFQEGVDAIQTDAAVNPGNSGGPLFNECGDVIGIVVRKALTQVMTVDQGGHVSATRVPEGEGIGWAVLVDELIPELVQAGIKPNIVDRKCVAAQARPAFNLITILAFLVALTALIFALTRRGRTIIRDVGGAMTQRVSITPTSRPMPVLYCLAGPFAGNEIPLTAGRLIMGRDPTQCQIVIGVESDRVSKRHCCLTVSRDGSSLMLEDLHSTNGTFIKPDLRLKSGQAYPILAGATFYLGDERVVFMIQ